MPTSHPALISPVATKILEVQPKRVLDIGVGFGKWGTLTREYTDVWSWRFYQPEWKTVIEGIEVHEKYRSPCWANYDHIHIGLAQDVLPNLGQYDMVTFLEVLEHLYKDEANQLLEEIFKHTKTAIISYSNCPQKGVRDNPFEDHVSTWTPEELGRFGNTALIHSCDVTKVFFIQAK